jgi:excisionase family DNA binding protein
VVEKESGNHSGTSYGGKTAKSKPMKSPLHGNPEILTPDEVAEFLRVSRRKINYLVAAKALPFVRIGRRVVRFKRHAVTKWLQEQNTQKKGR